MLRTNKAVVSEASNATHAEASPIRRRLHADWETAVIERVAPRVAELEEQAEREGGGEELYGWESAGLRHLSSHLSAKE